MQKQLAKHKEKTMGCDQPQEVIPMVSKQPKPKQLSPSELPLQQKLSLIKEMIGESVVFQVGMRKSGEIDLISIKTFFGEEQPQMEEAPTDDAPSYIG